MTAKRTFIRKKTPNMIKKTKKRVYHVLELYAISIMSGKFEVVINTVN